MNYNLNIQKLLLEADKLNNPVDRLEILKQTITLADAHNDIDWGFELRMMLIGTEQITSRCTDSPPAYAWLLDAVDNNPDLFNEKDILWAYSWMITSSCRNSNISKEQIEAIIEDFRMRLERNGYSLREYYNVLIYWQLFRGSILEAKEYIQLYNDAPKDTFSYRGDELFMRLRIKLTEGNLEEALLFSKELTNRKLVDGVVPLYTLCQLTYYLARKNDPRAAEYFVRTEEEFILVLAKDNILSIPVISDMLYYLSRHDKDKGWEYFIRYSAESSYSEDATIFSFCRNILPLFKEGGQKELNISPQLSYYSPTGIYDLSVLYDYYYKNAMNLAEKFDKRNGTDRFVKDMKLNS